MTQKLILMVGLPASGKSTKGVQLANDLDCIYVSRDYIRNFVELGQGKKDHKITKKLFMGFIEAALHRGETVIADATHLNEGSRKPLLELGKQYGAKNVAMVMNTSYETCIMRNAERFDEDRVPKNVMRSMAETMTHPKEKEGFESVHFYHEGEGYEWN